MNGVIISPVNIEERKTLGIKAGDTVRVWQKIEEKGKTRLQAFEGLVLARKHGDEAGGTFTVRKVSSGVGVEKIFPLYSPVIDKIEIVKRAKVRRSKLYYIREKVAREARRQLRRMHITALSTQSEIEQASAVEAKAAEEAAAAEQEEAAQESTATEEPKQEDATTEAVESSDTEAAEENSEDAGAEKKSE